MPAPHIFVVDDDENVREIIAHVLQLNDLEATCLKDGEELFVRLEHTLPDLIILDLMLPKMDGYAVVHRLQTAERTRSIPLIILTGKTENIFKQISHELGILQHMSKPFRPSELAHQVKILLAKSSPTYSSSGS